MAIGGGRSGTNFHSHLDAENSLDRYFLERLSVNEILRVNSFLAMNSSFLFFHLQEFSLTKVQRLSFNSSS